MATLIEALDKYLDARDTYLRCKVPSVGYQLLDQQKLAGAAFQAALVAFLASQ